MNSAWWLAFAASLCFAACGHSHGATGDDDGGGGVVDGGGVDGGSGGTAPGSGEAGSETLPCTPHTFACGSNDDVEVCNNAGTAWLYDHSCAVGCSDGVCTDPTCTPGATQCAGDSVQTCGSDGATWTTTQTCSTFCEAGQCALDGLTITGSSSSYDGTVVVAGDVVVGSGGMITAASGDLTIIADNITIEPGGAIAALPTSASLSGASCIAQFCVETPTTYECENVIAGANYGEPPDNGDMVSAVGGENESTVAGGGIGGASGAEEACDADASHPASTFGGGVLRLIASGDVTMAGQLIAGGQAAQGGDLSGGAGGGVQIVGDTIEFTGAISLPGGFAESRIAGYGRVRLLYGTSVTNTGTVIGELTQGRRPPITVTSATQPNPALVYNDDFSAASIAFERPFTNVQGYLYTVNGYSVDVVPSGYDGTFSPSESFAVPGSAFGYGANYVHVVAVDDTSTPGTVETTFPITINTLPPTTSSSSHPSATTWYSDNNPFFDWSYPAADASFSRVHYVLDHSYDTVPTKADTELPASQKQILLSGVPDGVWVFHVVAEDTVGNLTKAASHVVVQIGSDPGEGTIFGTIFDENDQPVSNAQVLVNGGIFSGVSAGADGSYSIANVPAGTWQVSVIDADHHVAPLTVTVTPGMSSLATFNLIHD